MSQPAQKEYFDELVGKTINNRYRLDEKLGAGAMGAVFRAVSVENNRNVAIKVISPNLVTDEKFVKRFEREADLGKLLKHNNIVAVEEFGQTEDKLFFIVMEFVPGETLKAYLTKAGALSPARCVELLTQLANALDFAHQHSVLHRDLKPENILVSKNEQGQEVLKLADFGIAKRTDLSKTKDQMLTVEGEIFGTPHYMSPEQVLAQKLKPTTDIYSIGVMLYQMLSGKLPLEHPKAQQLLVMKVSQDIPPISKKYDFVSPLFDPILQKVLSRAPSERYQTAGALLDAVKDVGSKLDPNIKPSDKPSEPAKVEKAQEKPPEVNKRNSGAINVKTVEELKATSQKIKASSGAFKSPNPTPAKQITKPNDKLANQSSNQTAIIIGVIIGLGMVLLIAALFIFFR